MTKIVLIILFIIIAATFCTLNRQEISLSYFFGWNSGSFPLFLLILTSLVAGMAAGFSVGWGERRKLRAKARELRDRVKALQEDIEPQLPQEEKSEPSAEPPEVPTPPLARG